MKVSLMFTRHSTILLSRTMALVPFTQAPSMPLMVSDAFAIPSRTAASMLSVELEMISIVFATAIGGLRHISKRRFYYMSQQKLWVLIGRLLVMFRDAGGKTPAFASTPGRRQACCSVRPRCHC